MDHPVVAIVLAAVVALGLIVWARARNTRVVYAWEQGLLYENGVFKALLGPGRYSLFAFGKHRLIETVPTYPQYAASGLVDVITEDRFPLRMAATVVYKITDPRLAVEERIGERIVYDLRQGLIAIASARTLQALLAERVSLGEVLQARLAAKTEEAEVDNVSISALTLPPEIRRLVVEVERAKLDGLAQLERARGEHAALRALANAARLMKDNPELADLRALQAVETARNATIVLERGRPAR